MPVLKDITLGRYVAGESALHRLDPTTKIVTVGVLIIGLLGTRSGVTPVGFIACALFVARACRLPLRLLLANLRPLLPLLALTLILNALLTPGKTWCELPWGAGRMTLEGAERGLFLVGRLVSLVLGTSLLTLVTSPLELADGIETLLRPFRRIGLPAHELAMTTTIALRFVPILVDEAERLRKAQLARGADFGGGPIRRVRSLFPLLLPLFLSAFGRADRLAIAMEARCYQGDRGRSRYRTTSVGAMDALALAGAILGSGLALCAGRL
ncbi:MAG: energy-coupling factor transporter transmembrane component T [Candidatus Latescibacteria bacterium]|nr:energy-coupling factor transporter transmembrane component T [Candidatus Latescibacterota bacterium]